MATQKPISTISYNSEAFLKEKLDTWISNHLIQSYMYIKHKGEDGDKDHIHVRIEPNKKLDPMDLQDALKEYTIGNSKPLGVRPFRPSKEEDWILYAVHDEQYLKVKYQNGEKGEKLPYKWEDIVAPEDYDTEIAYIRAKAHLEHTSQNMASRLRSGTSPFDLIMQGENVYTVNALMKALSCTDYERLTRDYQKLKSDFDDLLNAVEDYGLKVDVTDEGKIFLSPDID